MRSRGVSDFDAGRIPYCVRRRVWHRLITAAALTAFKLAVCAAATSRQAVLGYPSQRACTDRLWRSTGLAVEAGARTLQGDQEWETSRLASKTLSAIKTARSRSEDEHACCVQFESRISILDKSRSAFKRLSSAPPRDGQGLYGDQIERLRSGRVSEPCSRSSKNHSNAASACVQPADPQCYRKIKLRGAFDGVREGSARCRD